jgi:hypothetical protein
MTNEATVDRYRPRAVTQVGNWQVEHTVFKVYGLLADGRSVTQEMLVDAERFVRNELPVVINAEGRDNGLGFVIIHPGELGVSVLAHWWIQGCVLCQRIQRKLYGAPAPLAARPVVACVWELGLIGIEQQIWRDTMMSGMPDAAAYLTSRAEVTHV